MKVLVGAYFDLNFGDDLMVSMLANELVGHDVYLYCSDDRLLTHFKGLQNVHKHFHDGNWLQKIFQMSKFDVYIWIGGSIFNIQSGGQLVFHIKNVVRLMLLRLLGVKILIIGCNIGPFKSQIRECIVKFEIKLANLITVRDQKSLAFVNNAKFKNFAYFPDILLAYPIEISQRIDEGCLGISAYNPIYLQNVKHNYIIRMAAVTDEFINNTGRKVLFFAFDTGKEDDVMCAQAILNEVKNKDFVEIVKYEGNPESIIKNMQRCCKIIAVRFHSAIIAIKMGIPILPVIYSDKMENLLNDLGYRGAKYYIEELGYVGTKQIIDDLQDDVSNINPDIKLFANSKGHLEIVREFLDELKVPDSKVLRL